MLNRFLFYLLLGLLLPTVVMADTDNDFHFSGYIDSSDNYLLRSNHFTSSVHDRDLDLEPNGFTLQQIAFTLAKLPKQGFGGLLNIIAGRDANTLSPAGINPNYFGIQNFGVTPTQAYLQYALHSFTFIGGKFNCVMGAEGYNPTFNSHFSLSILNYIAQPSTFIGIKGLYVVNDNLNFLADINNGWDTIQYTSRQKTLEVSASYKINPLFSFSVTGVTGIQPIVKNASSGATSRRNALDIVATLDGIHKFTFIMNYDYGVQSGIAAWQGIAGYINYPLNDKWLTGLRGEVFYDKNGYLTGVRQTWKELTFTVSYVFVKALEFRAETRHDFSNVKSFVNSNGVGANNNQQSFALEMLYTF